MGVNLVAAFAEHTPVSLSSLREVVGIITGESPIPARLMDACGFIKPEGIQSIKATDNSHSFLVSYGAGCWHVYSSFFGGRIGAYVYFPGPNNEPWRTVRVIAPLKSRTWQISKSRLAQPLKVAIARQNSDEVAPSLGFHRKISETQITIHKRIPRISRERERTD
jgi:hypothetical protein